MGRTPGNPGRGRGMGSVAPYNSRLRPASCPSAVNGPSKRAILDGSGSFGEVLRRCCNGSHLDALTQRAGRRRSPDIAAAAHERHRAPILRTPGFAESSGGGVLRPRCCLAGAAASVPFAQSACDVTPTTASAAWRRRTYARRTPHTVATPPLFCDRLMALSAAADTCAELRMRQRRAEPTVHHLTQVQYGASMYDIAWIHCVRRLRSV